MGTDLFVQDLRIGLRVLLREKAFCAMAVTVLALGICGVTTTFSVVNGVMLRGFSFPNASRLVSVNLVDPTSRNFFGQNGKLSARDFEELRPQQRRALGADSRRILRMVLGQGSVLTGFGVGLGVLITLGLVRASGDGIQNVLFGVSPRGPLIYAAVIALVALVSLAASFVPALRATRVDPMIALRAE